MDLENNLNTPDNETNDEIKLSGIGASPGICIGKAYLVDKKGVEMVEKYFINRKNLDSEIKRFKAAVKNAVTELRSIIDNVPDEVRRHTGILETHIALLKDKMLYDKTIETIKNEKVNAEWALKKVVDDIKVMFQNISDSYLKERSEDITHVSDRIIKFLIGSEDISIGEIDKRVILVAKDLSPADASQIQLDKVMGFITDRGGKASHTSIIARTLEIPAVFGVGNATKTINNDDMIIIDGTTGVVIIHPSEQTLGEYKKLKARHEEHKAYLSRGSHLKAETLDGLSLQVMGNIELPEEVVSVLDHGGDGIGLYRTEFQYLSRNDFPGEDELFDKYKDVVEVMAPRPVTIRTLDINGDKAIDSLNGTEEINPALGLRAIRYCLKKPDIFKTQLRAILRAAAFGNVRILVPMISSIDEIRETKRLLIEAADSLEKEGKAYNKNIEFGIMIEVPSAVIMADVMALETDFFSIGTNDLIQYTLAIDRGNREVAHLYHPFHPAILRMIKHVTDVGKEKGIKVFMCGEMAGDPFNVPILLGLGMDELSMNPQSIPAVKNMIRSLKVEDARRFIKEALKQTTTIDVIKLVEASFGETFGQ
ncbi:MAG: phosphoenolpyruvate-protein phosphotransferase system enzyme [Thermodesulfobacteriota bacterium]|nr:phosphoenolpyruvate-protein phosphotransferase system enzyme [Thermodesulfobacteriota bacterium]